MGQKVEEEGKELALKIARILDECRPSQAVHQRKLRELSAVRSKSQVAFASSFVRALTPLFDASKKTASTERIVRFVSAFAARRDGKSGDAFLVQFLKVLLVAAQSVSKTARLRSCQIISQILMLLPNEADVSDNVWDAVIDCMKERVEDKVPDVRAFAVHALSFFANDGACTDIVDLLLRALSQESSAEVRRTIVQSLPPSNSTLTSIINCTLDVHESVRKAAYGALASNFPLQSLSIKIRTMLLRRGLMDRSPSVRNECMKMLKEEWLIKCCDGDLITLLRCLDVETYESEGEAVMDALFEEGSLHVLEGQSIQQFLSSKIKKNEGIQLMEPEVVFYWRIICKHLKTQAEVKGSEAAVKTGAEAAVYASEAMSGNDLLESVLPASVSDYIDLVNAHISAGPNFRFSTRQLLLLGATLDFSDVANRKVASCFVRELLCRPFDHDVDEEGQKVLIGDGINLGGDRDWCRAVAALTKKVHAGAGEFEELVNSVAAELSLPCRERTADMIGWTHCLALASLLLENVESHRSLRGTSELLHSLLLPAARHVHVDVQRAGVRCLGLFGLLESRPSEELVKQLRLAFVNGQPTVKVMASRALLDLATWHGPAELDKAIGLDPPNPNEKKSFACVDLSIKTDNLNADLLDLLYSGFQEEDFGQRSDGDERETVHCVLGEGFAKILLLREKYPSIPSSLHPLILGRLICIYFCSESKDHDRLKQCLSVFFDHYASLSEVNKACISRAFVPVMRSLWPGVSGSSQVEKKRAVNVSRFMLQLMQTPLRQTEASPGGPSGSEKSTLDIDGGDEGLAIRIGTEIASFPARITAAWRSYVAALSKIAVDLKFRSSEQIAIKYMRKLIVSMIHVMSKEREMVKELTRMEAKLRLLDKTPDEELTAEIAADIRQKLELDLDARVDWPGKAAAPPRRRRRRQFGEMSDDDDDADVEFSTPVERMGVASEMRAARKSKTAAMRKLTTSAAADCGGDEWDVTEESDDDSE